MSFLLPCRVLHGAAPCLLILSCLSSSLPPAVPFLNLMYRTRFQYPPFQSYIAVHYWPQRLSCGRCLYFAFLLIDLILAIHQMPVHVALTQYLLCGGDEW